MEQTYGLLHCHTDYSNALLGFPDSINKTNKIIQYAYDIGLSGISISDHEGISAYIQAEKYYHSMKKERPFKLLRGNEIYLLTEEEDMINRDKENPQNFPYYHFLLTALTPEGCRLIRVLSDKAWRRSYYKTGLRRRPTYREELTKIMRGKQGHIIASGSCIGGNLGRYILGLERADSDENKQYYRTKIKEFINWGIETFGRDYFFMELQPCHKNNDEQQCVNRHLWQLAEHYGLKCIITTDAHYMTKEDAFKHKVFLASKDGGDSRETEKFYSTTYMMSPQELRTMLIEEGGFTNEQVDEMFRNTNAIVDMAEDYSLKNMPTVATIPPEKLEDFTLNHYYANYYHLYPNIEFCALNEVDSIRHLWYKVETGLYEKIQDGLINEDKIQEYLKHIDYECGEIKAVGEALNTNMFPYFTTVQKIIDIAWNEGDSLIGCGRGSSVSSNINYALSITGIDPVKFGDLLPFWRFMSVERGAELADIDFDCQSSRAGIILEEIKKFWGYDKVQQCATFAKLSPKTALIKAGKGLGIDDEIINSITALIPIVRGKQRPLDICLHGGEYDEEYHEPVHTLVSESKKYPDMFNLALELGGVITQMGIHASAINIMNHPYTDTTSAMIAPNGSLVSAFDLHDEEYTGTVKIDLLKIDALEKIRATLDLLVEYNQLEWQGNLRKTYTKYLAPERLELHDKKMWEKINKIYSCFQWDTPVGSKGLAMIQPRSWQELTAGNSLIRLQGSGDGKSPLELYVYYKQNIENWHNDMREYGLTDEDIKILKEYLDISYGVMENQESCMKIVMDARVSNFTMKESNTLRKAIAKKSPEALSKAKALFYEKGVKLGTSTKLLDYIWNVQISMSLGYSFSVIHSLAYSFIAIQELNLAYRYPDIFWHCGCLVSESKAFEYSDIEEADNSINYAKIANAIYKMKKLGINVSLPDLYKSSYGFVPNLETNTIQYSLKAIQGLGDDATRELIQDRNNFEFTSFAEFYQFYKNKPETFIKKNKIIRLIKSGALDCLHKSRIYMMKMLAVYETQEKTTLTTNNLSKCIELGVSIPEEIIRPYRFKQYVLSKQFYYCPDPKHKSKKHYIVEQTYALPYLTERYLPFMQENKDYYYNGDDLIIIDKSLEKVMKNDIDVLKQHIKKPEVVQAFNKAQYQATYNVLIKGVENLADWEMDTVSYYNEPHPLLSINDDYNLSMFSTIPEQPKYVEESYRRKKDGEIVTYRKYVLHRIAGTIIELQHNKHYIKILTPEGEVVTVKFQQGQYAYYKNDIIDYVNDSKIVREKGWLKKGNKIMVTGYRREDIFIAKKYKNSILKHGVMLIDKINYDGSVDLRIDRWKEGEEEQWEVLN